MSNSKKGKRKESQRRWTKEEIEKFRHSKQICSILEKLALKKSSSN